MRLTDKIPLRTSADLGAYTEIYTLPRVLGQTAITPVRYDASGHLWLLSDGVIEGVDRVEMDGAPISAWSLQIGADDGGHPVSVLETQAQVTDPGKLRVSLRGELHPRTGQRLERPDLQLEFIAQLAGLGLEPGQFDDLRAHCETAGLKTAGVLDDHTQTVQHWMDAVARGAGLAWSLEFPGIGLPWPQAPDADTVATLDAADSPRLGATAAARDLCTRLELEYAYDPSRNDRRAVLVLRAPTAIDRYGEITRRITADWLQDARAALAYGTRYLEYYARPLWTLTASAPISTVAPGQSVAIDHPLSPVTAGRLTERTRDAGGETWVLQAPAGAPPTVQIERSVAGVAIDPAAALLVQIQDDTAAVLITDPNGAALPGARVTVDGATTKIADAAGWVYLPADNAEHELLIQYPGLTDQRLRVILQ